ncbi:MAG: YitT family protein, partial [Clostridiales bacterium]|nr:YitT family protein [Clostridiales bacterium]
YHLSGGRFPVGVTMLVLNVPLFIGGFRYVGGRFAVRTLFSTVFLSLAIDLGEPFTSYFIKTFITQMNAPTTPDLLLYAVFGGMLCGVGLGIVFRSGATTGGTDLAARIVHHFLPHFSMGKLLLFIDGAVIVFAAIAFKSFLLALYAVVALYISSKVIDSILEGVNFAKAVYIISDKSDIIAQRIMSELDRGVTGLKGTGMYTGNDKQVLYCVINRVQLPVLKLMVREIDPNAFVIMMDIREVLGEGFKSYE